jgi:hypothetical protein
MNNAESILVVIVSATLTVFLIVSIAALIMLMQVLARVKRLAHQAEHVIDTAEKVGEVFKDVAGPLSLLKAIRNVGDKVKHKSKEE